MKHRTRRWTVLGWMVALGAAPALAADDPKVLKDLTSVIALLALPCGQVIAATEVKENDHLVTCKDGNKYRVFLNAEGRVVAQKQKSD